MNNSYWLFEGFLTIIADEKSTDGRYDLIEGTPFRVYITCIFTSA